MDFVNLYEWIGTITPDTLPPAPFESGAGGRVTDTAKWLASLQSDARGGPKSPRARWGSLQADLRRVYELTTISNCRERSDSKRVA